jgi:hypothetical protein
MDQSVISKKTAADSTSSDYTGGSGISTLQMLQNFKRKHQNSQSESSPQ